MDHGILAQLGIKVPNMFAGAAGGLVGAMVSRKAGIATFLSYFFSGALTSNFLAKPALHVMPDWVGEGGAGFIIGLGAMTICALLIGAINKWNPLSGSKST